MENRRLRLCNHRDNDRDNISVLRADSSAQDPGQDPPRKNEQTQVDHSQHGRGNKRTAEKAVSTVRGLAGTCLAVLQDRIPFFECEKRHTNDPVREDLWTEIQERDPAIG